MNITMIFLMIKCKCEKYRHSKEYFRFSLEVLSGYVIFDTSFGRSAFATL